MAFTSYSAIVTQLKNRLSDIGTELAAIGTSTPPNYSIDGQTINHSDRIKALHEEMETITRMINRLEPYSVMSRART